MVTLYVPPTIFIVAAKSQSFSHVPGVVETVVDGDVGVGVDVGVLLVDTSIAASTSFGVAVADF